MPDCTCNNFPASLGNVTFGGQVGINKIPTWRRLDVLGDPGNVCVQFRTPGGAGPVDTYGLLIIERQDGGTGKGVGMAFDLGDALSPTADVEYGYIGAVIEHNSASARKGTLVFHTVSAGSRTEQMRIDSQGRVGIGTPTPSEKLEVNGNVKVAGKGTFGGETTQGLAIGNGRIFAFADQGNPSRLDVANGVVQIIGDAPDVNGGVYIRIKSAAEGGQGAFRVRNMGNTVDMLRVTAAGEVYVNEVKAINAQGYCLFAP